MPYQIVKKVHIPSRREWYRGEHALSLGVDLEDDKTWKFFGLQYAIQRQIKGKVLSLLDENGNLMRRVNEEYFFDVALYYYYGDKSQLIVQRFMYLPKEFVQSYAIDEGAIVKLVLEEVIKDGKTEGIFSKAEVIGPQDVAPKENTEEQIEEKKEDKDTTTVIAYCTNCGCPQGTFDSIQEMRKYIANHSQCKQCSTYFSFQADEQIYYLKWEIFESKNKRQEENVYGKGDAYDFYREIKRIVSNAKTEVFLIDAWIDEEALDLYLDKMPANVKIRILTKKPQGNFATVAKKFKIKPNVTFEVRSSSDCHDRLLFIDNNCWVMGQSIRDAGIKPTYLIKTENCMTFRIAFEAMWKSATVIV